MLEKPTVEDVHIGLHVFIWMMFGIAGESPIGGNAYKKAGGRRGDI